MGKTSVKKIIMKFGGTSVGTPDAILQISKIISSSKEPVAGIIVSAFSKITNKLIETADLASKGDIQYESILQNIMKQHVETVQVLITDPILYEQTLEHVESVIFELESILRGIFLIKDLSPKMLDTILSYGERLSAYIITQSFINQGLQAEFLDSRNIIKTDSIFGNAHVNFKITNKNIVKNFKKSPLSLKVITGFIASTDNNETTTLGRGGSDYTASIIGAALGVAKIEIWTDVDGVLTADPRKVPSTFTIPSMTYKEAMEMSHFGAKVIYPQTMIPALTKNIPLLIRNTFNPKFQGTVVSTKTSKAFVIKGISSIEKVAVFLVQGSGMIGVPGYVMRLFSCLAVNKVNIIMITQASSEHTICFAIDPIFIKTAQYAIEEEFKHEINEHLMDPLTIEKNLSIIAIVGENMRNTVGISGELFTVLANKKISIIAIAQGSSERNISVIINNKDEMQALRAIHKTFFEKKI